MLMFHMCIETVEHNGYLGPHACGRGHRSAPPELHVPCLLQGQPWQGMPPSFLIFRLVLWRHTLRRLNAWVVKQMAKDMDRVDFTKGDLLLDQGAPQTKAFFIGDGTIKRERVVNDQSHQVRAVLHMLCLKVSSMHAILIPSLLIRRICICTCTCTCTCMCACLRVHTWI